MATAKKPVSRQKAVGVEIVDPNTGKVLFLKGYGAMKGIIEFDKDIDLTKPIYEQALKLEAIHEEEASNQDAT